MLVSFSYSSIMSFIIMYTETINLVEIGSLFYVFYAAIIILSRPFTGRLMDQRGENIIIYPSLIIFALGMVVYSQANHSIFIVIAAILIGLGFGNFNSISQAVALKSTTPERFGMATATYFAFFDFGLGVGPFIIGHFVSVIGFRSIYLAMAGITMLAFILYYLMHRKV